MAETHQATITPPSWAKHGSKASYSMGSNHMHQWRHEDIRHQKGISNKAPPSPRAPSSTKRLHNPPSPSTIPSGSSRDHHQLINHTRDHQGHQHISKARIGSKPWPSCLQASTRLHRTVTTARVTIKWQVSYSYVVGIKDKHQTGVGINDTLQQQKEVKRHLQ